MGSESGRQGTEFTLGPCSWEDWNQDHLLRVYQDKRRTIWGGGEVVEMALMLLINLSSIFWSALTKHVAW